MAGTENTPPSNRQNRHKTNLGYAPRPPLAVLALCGRCRHTGDIGFVVASSELAVGGSLRAKRTSQGLFLCPVSPDDYIGETALTDLDGRDMSPQAVLTEAAQGDPLRRNRLVLLMSKEGKTGVYTGRAHTAKTESIDGDDIVAVRIASTPAEPPIAAVATKFGDAEEHALFLSERLMSAVGQIGAEDMYRSAALYIVDETNFPIVDLRVDNDAAPIARLAKIYQDYMRDDVKLDAYLPSKDHPTGFAPSAIDDTLRWLRRYGFKVRTYFQNRSNRSKEK